MIRTSSMPELTDSDRKTVEELVALLPSRWPVDSLVLYGSKARGDDTPESDIDLLVLTGRPLAPEEIGELRAVSRRIGLTHGTWPELYIRTSEDWWRGVYQAAPIRKEIDAEGVTITLPLPGDRR